ACGGCHHRAARRGTAIPRTDSYGKFTLHGFGPNPSFSMCVFKPGYEDFRERVTVTQAGIVTAIPALPASAEKPSAPVDELVVTLRKWQQAWFEGHAVDADTVKPVRLDRVAVLNYERGPNGEIVPCGTLRRFEQPEPGHFRAFFDDTGEFRLTCSATGYDDAK